MTYGLKRSFFLHGNANISGVYLAVLLAYAVHTAIAVRLIGSGTYAIEGRKYTLTCNTRDSPTPKVEFWETSSNKHISTIIVNKGQCTVRLFDKTEICDPNICSCITDGDHLGTEFMWRMVINSSHHLSAWACFTESGQNSVITIKTKVPVSSVNIQHLDGFNTLTTEEGENATLTCISDSCRPASTLFWYIDGENYTSYSVNQVVNQEDRYVTLSNLTISPTRDLTGKRIICTGNNIENETIESSQQPLLNVIFGPTITFPSNQAVYIENESSNYTDIVCTAYCNPTCIIFWITPNGNSNNDSVLSLGKWNRTDSGVYKCIARNVLGEDEIKITLTVNFGPTIAFYPPEVVYINLEGSILPEIKCMASCKPSCTFIWTKPNGRIINDYALSVGKIDRSKSGRYKCTARNSAGGDEKYIQITVHYAPVVKIRAQSFTEGDTDVKLICEANGEPNNYQFGSWMQTYGSTIIRNPLISQGNLIITPGILKFKKITLEDIGTYSCEVQNGIIGLNNKLVQTGSSFINVTALPKLLDASKSYTVSINERFNLALDVFSNPAVLNMEFRRYFPDVKIRNSSALQVSFTELLVHVPLHGKKVPMLGCTAELNILNFTSDIEGKYLLNLTNTIGTTVHVFNLLLQRASTTGLKNIFDKNLLNLVLIVISSVIIFFTVVAVVCMKIRQARDSNRSNKEVITLDTSSLRSQEAVQGITNRCYESLQNTRTIETGTGPGIQQLRYPFQERRSSQECMSGIYDTIQEADTCFRK